MQINLRKRHLETQKYVGAFQQLAKKQKRFDSFQNEGNAKTIEIDHLLVLAKNLLCEIETVINNTRQSMPLVFTRQRMDKALTFRNNNSIGKYGEEIDELDNKFAKVRFHEYVLNLQEVLKPGRKNSLFVKGGKKANGEKRKKKPNGNKRVKKVNGEKRKKKLAKGAKTPIGKGPRKLNKRKNLNNVKPNPSSLLA